jgi:uncharacterized protein YlxW (UPF0749 family)
MTERTEPSLSFSGLFGTNTRKSQKSPEVLVSEALQSFAEAQAQLDKAQAQIEQQIQEHQEEIQRRQELLTDATAGQSRLARVKARIEELLA